MPRKAKSDNPDGAAEKSGTVPPRRSSRIQHLPAKDLPAKDKKRREKKGDRDTGSKAPRGSKRKADEIANGDAGDAEDAVEPPEKKVRFLLQSYFWDIWCLIS